MRHLNYEALKQRRFEPGAILVKDGKRYEIADPFREAQDTLASLFNPLIATADKLRVIGLRRQLARLSIGDIILPAEGMQRIPEQLAQALPRGTVRTNARVSELLIDGEQVRGVRLMSGEQIEAEQVVIATSSPVAERFVKETLPTKPRSVTCLYFAGDELIAERCRAELAHWFPDHNLLRWQLLAVYRIPFAQFAQPVGIFDELPDNRTDIEGLYLAGEYTRSSSIQGAIHSGEHAAREILKTALRVPSH